MDVAAPSAPAPCSSLRVSAGASYRCSGLKMDAAALSALQLAPLLVGASCLGLWFDDGCCALSALQLAMFVGRSFVPLPLI